MEIDFSDKALNFFARSPDWERGDEAKASWRQHLQRWHIPWSGTRTEEVRQAHQAAGRHYHNLVHIVSLLDWIGQLELDPDLAQRLVWTALYHDLVYDTRRTDNEAASAEIAGEDMRAMEIPDREINWVTECIRRTSGHQGNGADDGMRLFLDLDLLVLGAPEPIYLKYAAAIRMEYGWVPEQAYKEGRSRVLHHFLDRPKIYYTEEIAKSFENQARSNMQTEMMQWKT